MGLGCGGDSRTLEGRHLETDTPAMPPFLPMMPAGDGVYQPQEAEEEEELQELGYHYPKIMQGELRVLLWAVERPWSPCL